MKVLCYSPYNMWELHGLWEGTILHALKQKGADIKYVLCDGLYKECDVFWGFVSGFPRPTLACNLCQARVANLMHRLQFPYEWLGRYLDPEELNIAQSWVESLSPSEFFHATYQNWSIGEWVKGSNHTHFRSSEIDLTQATAIEVYKGYLYSGLVAAFAINRLLESWQPDRLLLFNGRLSNTRVAMEIAQLHKVHVIVHERGSSLENLRLLHNQRITMSYDFLQKTWKKWENIPLLKHQVQAANQLMTQRMHGKNLSWVVYSPKPSGEIKQLYEKFDIPLENKIWTLFPSSEDEVIAEKDRLFPYQKQADWIFDTINFVAQKPNITLIIRVHPNIGSISYHKVGAVMGGENKQQYQFFKDLQHKLPANVRMIMPEDNISSYDLMDISSVGLTIFSSTALEFAFKGKYSIVGCKSFYANSPFVKTLSTLSEYPELLEELALLPAQYFDADLSKFAHRFIYMLYMRWNIPFPLVKMPDPHSGELNYQSFDELAPGRDLALERICEIILNKQPICPEPNAYDQLISAQDEAIFFQQIAEEIKSIPIELEQTNSSPQAASASPKVSIVIPCYNYGDYLHDAVQSILKQSFQDFEIILVNDGSTDDSAQVCERILKAYPEYAITVIHQPNSGQPAYPRNRGLAIAKGQYALCLDADDMLSPQTLEACVNCLEQNPQISIAYPYLREIGDSHLLWKPTEYDPNLLLHWNFIPTASMFRLQAWKDCGGYASNVISHEDWDFWIHCASKGHFGKLASEATMWYRIHGDSLIRSNDDPHQRLRLKAQIMLNHPEMYGTQQLQWAQAVINKADWALNIKINPSYMPKFEQDILPDTYQNMLKSWKSLQLSPFQRLSLERPLYQTEALWFKTDAQQVLIRSSAPGDILDVLMGETLPESLPKQLWVPNEAALQLVKQRVAQTDTQFKIIPRFIPEQAIQRTNTLDFDAPHGMIVVLKHIDFLENLKPLLSQASPDLALAILWQGLAVEDAYDQLSQKLEEMGFTEETLPELVLLDAEQIQNPEEMFPDAIRAALIETEADLNDKWQLSALHCGLLLLVPSPFVKPFADYLQEQEAPEYLQNWTKAGNECYQAIPDFAANWNKSVWGLMQAAIADI